jgi:transcriptional regulator with XRE-family HTH domain
MVRFDHDKVKALREEAGISQTQLAGLADVHFNTIATLERDGGNPTASTIAAIATALGVEPADLFIENGTTV